MDILGFGCMAGIIGIYDSASGESRISSEPFGTKVYALRFSADGSRLFAAVGDSVYELSTADFQVIRDYPHPDRVKSFYLNSVDQMMYTSSGNKVMLWDLRAENQYQTLVFRDNPYKDLNRIDYLASKHLLVGAQSEGYVPRWDTRTGRLLSAWNAGRFGVQEMQCLAISPQWIWAAGACGTIFQLNSHTFQLQLVQNPPIKTREYSVVDCALLPNHGPAGSTIVLRRKFISLWNLSSKIYEYSYAISSCENDACDPAVCRLFCGAARSSGSAIYLGWGCSGIHLFNRRNVLGPHQGRQLVKPYSPYPTNSIAAFSRY